MWKMMQESNSLHCQSDLESAINGENPMLTSFVPVKSDNIQVKEPSICGSFCLKSCFALALTSLMSPFIICDMYFALTDTSCVHQSFDKLIVTMYSYLLVSAIFGIVTVSILSCSILCFNFEKKESKDGCNEFCEMCCQLFVWILKLFGLSWSILGFVIFWGYMNTDKCARPVYNYLLVKFIIIIVTIFLEVTRNKKQKKK
jgi:hypothetical protein